MPGWTQCMAFAFAWALCSAALAGVILWDEPRKAPPPPRQAGAENGGGAVLAASVVYRQ